MMVPKIHLTAFEDRSGDFIFVGVPDQRGRYVRTDKSVAIVECPLCKAVVGEPCIHSQGYGGGTHACRRDKARRTPPYGYKGVDDILTIELDENGSEKLG